MSTDSEIWSARGRDGSWARLYAGTPNLVNHRFRSRRLAVDRLLSERSRSSSGGPQPRVLDVGCATGAFVDVVEARSFLGLDRAPDMIRAARDAQPSSSASFAVATAERLPIRTASHDVVLAIGLLGFLADPVPALAEFRRVLRHGGALLVQGHMDDLWTRRGAGRRGAGGGTGAKGTGERPLDVAALDRLTLPRGFEREDVAFADVRLLPARIARALPRLAMGLSNRLTSPGLRLGERFAASAVVRYRAV